MALNPNPPPSTRLCQAHALIHVDEYARAVHALTPSTLTASSIETIMTLHHLHPLAKVTSPLSLMIFI
jgi:hypothetical protein